MTEMNTNQTPEKEPKQERTFTEELEVAGDQLVQKVRELISAGNVRRIIVTNTEGRVYLEIPLTVGVIAGGALIWIAPILSALGAIGALLARVRIEVVREGGEEGAVSEAKIDAGSMLDDVTSAVSKMATQARAAVEKTGEAVSHEKSKHGEEGGDDPLN